METIKKELTQQFYYPNGYYDFSNGVPVSETEINMWILNSIDKIKAKIKEHPDREQYFHHISSGNTKVIIECYRQGNPEKFTVYVSVATSYKTKSELDITFD